MSLGFNGLLYPALYDYFLPFKALRVPARMGLMVGFSLAVLAGYGAARVAGRLRSEPARRRRAGRRPGRAHARRVRVDAAAVLARAAAARRRPTPISFETAATVRPPCCSSSRPGCIEDAAYLYYSTFHWQWLVNGYSGFFPPSYGRLVRAMQNFPDEPSIDAIKSHGARYLVIHGEYLRGDRYKTLIPQLDQRRDLTLVSRHPWRDHVDKHAEISLYRRRYPD